MHALLAASLLAVATPSSALPSGEYHYVIYSDNKVAGTSSVTIAHTASAVTVNEAVILQGENVHTTRTLDPKTFSTLSWSGYNDKPTDWITIAPTGATYKHQDANGANAATTALAPAAAGAPAALFDFFVGEYVTLPAMVYATGANRYNEYCECFNELKVEAIAIGTAPTGRPTAMLPGDEGLVLTANGKSIELWYDPKTLLMGELDVPEQHIRYVRV